MEILVIDGQGGGLGRQLVAAVKKAVPQAVVTAIGTNSAATSAMLKAGADRAATGENAVVVGCRRADVILGPIGIVMADALLGEITPAMAQAVAQSDARRILIPAKLREYAGLTKEVVVVGSFDRAEIWSAERWAAIENEAFSSGALEQAMAEMGL